MRFSVICNTYNRANCLRVLLQSLQYQTYPDFEVVVVNGPSTDDTASVLREYAGRIRAYSCPQTNLSMSRNIGIAAASGDLVAFIDDDGVPEPRWLEEMLAGFTHPGVAAVGGIVYDHTGHRLQYANVVCDRAGEATINVPHPLTEYQVQGAEPYLHLMGGNTSYRREVLAAIGGFDEEIEYYLDEAELCLQLNDRGFWLTQSPRAAMLHKSAPSDVRNEKRVIRRPYAVVKNKCYFALQSARKSGRSLATAIEAGLRFAEKFTGHGQDWLRDGLLTPAEHSQFTADIERALQDGLARGVAGKRKSAAIPPADPAAFLPFPVLTPPGRLTVCFISSNYPPEPLGGIGRYTHELAAGMAGFGHEVHVVARTTHHPTVDFEGGVWVHRVPAQATGEWDAPGLQPLIRRCLGWAAAAHAEVKQLAATRPVDLVHSCIWDIEGLFCQLDDNLRSILTLVTSLKTVVDLSPRMLGEAGIPGLLALERLTVRSAAHVLAPSRNVLEKVNKEYGVAISAQVVPLGVPDRAAEFSRRRGEDGRVRVLFVGRLEPRKGTDLLLAAAAELCPTFPAVEFVLVGDATQRIVALGATYKDDFLRRHGAAPWADRVIFRGAVSDDQLCQEYADCDIFCLPARFESFGLVLVEAMLFGKPVVGCAIGGMAEIIEDGATGLLAYPGSAGSLTRCLRELIADPGQRTALGRAARARYEAEYSTAVMTRNTVRAYARLLGAAA